MPPDAPPPGSVRVCDACGGTVLFRGAIGRCDRCQRQVLDVIDDEPAEEAVAPPDPQDAEDRLDLIRIRRLSDLRRADARVRTWIATAGIVALMATLQALRLSVDAFRAGANGWLALWLLIAAGGAIGAVRCWRAWRRDDHAA